jgi:hypothetical protein
MTFRTNCDSPGLAFGGPVVTGVENATWEPRWLLRKTLLYNLALFDHCAGGTSKMAHLYVDVVRQCSGTRDLERLSERK